MVRAILEGRKTQTRRIVKSRYKDRFGWGTAQPLILGDEECFNSRYKCPYGKPGDRLWVRETWCPDVEPYTFRYKADGDEPLERWRPSIHIPRWASRITLEVVSVRVERLQNISEDDALAEGITLVERGTSPVDQFNKLWESINGPGSWEANPWVWVVEFKRIEP